MQFSSMVSKYAGETWKNVFMHGINYVLDVEKKRYNKPLWKHTVQKHHGVMDVPIFSHFHKTTEKEGR